MDVVLIKKTLENGLATPESIDLERKFRASSFWAQMGNKQLRRLSCASTTAEGTAPALMVVDGETTEFFTDFASFEQYGQPVSTTPSSLEAACW